MAQNYTEDVYASGHVGATDLQNIENNFAVQKSSFSGASSPSNPVAGMQWFDTTNTALRLRDSGNAAWLAFLTGDSSQKLWIYRNDSVEGWAIDATVSDRVLAIKGGTQAYNVNGGTNAGTWTIGGGSVDEDGAHNHVWYNAADPASADRTYSSGGTGIDLPLTTKNGSLSSDKVYISVDEGTGLYEVTNVLSSAHTSSEGIHSHSLSFDGTHRSAAAVGTMQYPDI